MLRPSGDPTKCQAAAGASVSVEVLNKANLGLIFNPLWIVPITHEEIVIFML